MVPAIQLPGGSASRAPSGPARPQCSTGADQVGGGGDGEELVHGGGAHSLAIWATSALRLRSHLVKKAVTSDTFCGSGSVLALNAFGQQLGAQVAVWILERPPLAARVQQG